MAEGEDDLLGEAVEVEGHRVEMHQVLLCMYE